MLAITGAAGNLGSILAKEFKKRNISQNLLIHKKDVDQDFKNHDNINIFRVDLAKPETLDKALEGVSTVVHFAGVLFKANPEKFLPVTNIQYFKNLIDACVKAQVKNVILISFPHVEGESTPDKPAIGLLTGQPESMHAKTRLEEEKLLFSYAKKYGINPISLRVGMVYGKGILMIDVAQWFARHYLLGIWKTPTYIHLISKIDFANAVAEAATKPGVTGIYHLGDEGVNTLQEFLDDITKARGNHKPWRMPLCMIMLAARISELFSLIFGVRSPLTVDFIRIGMVSYYGDTSRFRDELLPELKFKTYKEGISLF